MHPSFSFWLILQFQQEVYNTTSGYINIYLLKKMFTIALSGMKGTLTPQLTFPGLNLLRIMKISSKCPET